MSALSLAIALTKEYLTHVEDMEGSITQSALCISEMETRASLPSIEKWLRTWFKNNAHHIKQIDHIGQIRSLDTTNLLYPHSVGYHRMLRKINQPTILTFDETNRTIRKQKTTYQNERVEKFTMMDLQLFWNKSMGLRQNDASDQGRFRYLLGKYELDLILYAIDCLGEKRNEEGKRYGAFVLDLERMIPEAIERLEAKKNAIKRENLEWSTSSF